MPTLQFFILIFFIFDAMYKLWYDWGLIVLCLIVGLFGMYCTHFLLNFICLLLVLIIIHPSSSNIDAIVHMDFHTLLCFDLSIGGARYVHGFSRLSEHVDPSLREFSLSAASIGDTVGVIFGDVASIFIQNAIYQKHDLSDDE